MAAPGRLRGLSRHCIVSRNSIAQYRETFLRMCMGTACDPNIALRSMFVGAGAFRRILHITAYFVMSRVVFAQTTCTDSCAVFLCSKRHRWQHPRHQTSRNKYGKYSFPTLHRCSTPLQSSYSLQVPKAVVRTRTTMFLSAVGLDIGACFLIITL